MTGLVALREITRIKLELWASNPTKKGTLMHYKNGREAKAGDVVIQILPTATGYPPSIITGVLLSIQPNTTQDGTCNGLVAPTRESAYVNIKDCMHVDDVASIQWAHPGSDPTVQSSQGGCCEQPPTVS